MPYIQFNSIQYNCRAIGTHKPNHQQEGAFNTYRKLFSLLLFVWIIAINDKHIKKSLMNMERVDGWIGMEEKDIRHLNIEMKSF